MFALVSEYGAFETLYDYMNFSQMVKNYEQLKSLPQCGEIVIAKYSDDQWYRAQVKSIKLQETAVSSANIKVLQLFYFIRMEDQKVPK